MRKRPYPDLWENLHHQARACGFPLRVMFELTYGCNFKCRHCYVPGEFQKNYRSRQLSTKKVFSLLDGLKRLGCLYLGFTGGEPFTRKDIFPIIDYAVRSGFQVIVYTNGSLIDKAAAQRLARLALNKIDITLPAVTDAAFNRITGTRGMRGKVFAAARQLHGCGVPLGFKTCVVKENADQVSAIRAFARSLGGGYRLDSGPSPRLDGDREPVRYGCEKMLRKTDPGQRRQDKTDRARAFACGAGTAQAAITPAGELKMCVMRHRPLFSVVDKGLEKAWLRLKAIACSSPAADPVQGASARSAKACTLCPEER